MVVGVRVGPHVGVKMEVKMEMEMEKLLARSFSNMRKFTRVSHFHVVTTQNENENDIK